MAQLILKGTLQTSAADAFANGPSNVTQQTLYWDDSNNATFGAGTDLFTDAGMDPLTDTFTPGSNGWWYTLDGNRAIQIDGTANLGRVLDIENGPIITLNGDSTEYYTVGSTWTDAGATATDVEDGNVTGITMAGATSGDTLNSTGNTSITYDVSDSDNYPALTVTRLLTVYSYDTFSASASTVDEGGTIIFTLNGTNIPGGTTIPYAVTGISSADLSSSSTDGMSGSITVDFGTGSLTFTLNEDLTTESAETLTVTLDPQTLGDSNGAYVGSLSDSVTVNDTSIGNDPPTIIVDPLLVSVTNDINDGNLEWVSINLGNNISGNTDNDPLTYTILDPGNFNGSLAESQGGSVISQWPHAIANNGSTIWYTPGNVFNQGSESFDYKVDDGTNDATGTVTVTVSPPVNTAPTAENYTGISLDGEISNTATRSYEFQRKHSETPSAQIGETYSFQWVDDSNGTNVLTDVQLNNSLSHGTVAITAGDGTGEWFTYTLNNNVDLNPSSSQLTETFYYQITETNTTESYSARGQIDLSIQPPGNTPPQFTTPGSSPHSVSVDQFSFVNINIAVTDGDGDNITFNATQPPSGQGAVDISNLGINGTIKYTPGSYQGNTTFTLTANDPYGGSASMLFNVTVNASPYVAVRISPWGSSSSIACNDSRGSQNYYLNTAQAVTLNELTIGDSIYVSTALSDTWAPIDAAFGWVSVAEATDLGNVISYKIDTNGIIEEVVACQVTGGQAWPIEIGSSSSVNAYCNLQSFQTGIVYQNISEFKPNGVTPFTLGDVVEAGGQLFNSEYYANAYAGQTAPANIALGDGLYNFVSSYGKYYSYQNGVWQINTDTSSPYYNTTTFGCPPEVTWEVKSLTVKWLPEQPTEIGYICNATSAELEDITIYYKVPQGITYTLKDLAINQKRIFTSESAALSNDYSQLFQSAVLLYFGKYFIWNNDDETGYTGAVQWYGFNSITNEIELASIGSSGGVCLSPGNQDYIREEHTGLSYEIGSSTGTRPNAYYAFYGCEVQLDAGIPGGDSYWPLYVIDGFHTADLNSTSFVKDFISTVGDTVTHIKSSECMTLKHKVWGLNIQDAINQLEDNISVYRQDRIRAIAINPQDIGIGSQSIISYGYSDCGGCLTNPETVNTYQFPIVEDFEILNRTIPNFNLETNYELDNVSKPLLRTNPKLSTNAKLVANLNDQVFIESIDATKELASVSYKRWEVNKDGQYSYDLKKFYEFSYTTSDIMYATKVEYSDYAVQETFDKQIEELYQYGTKYNYSKLHDEDYRIFAPIWLDKAIPRKFVIFRVSDPTSSVDFDNRSMFNNMQDLLKNSEIIKTFDLTKDSTLGSYIRNHMEDEGFPKTPITFNFDENEKSTFNGIDLKKGGFTKKGEFLHDDFVKADAPLISSNQLITDGFERNNIACANLLNLEFLFNDDLVSDYGINRYFGVYVNDIDSGYGSISTSENGNIVFDVLNSNINNDSWSAIPSFKHISQTPTIGYVSISDEYYKISSRSNYIPKNLNVVVEDSGNKIPNEIKIAPNGNSIDITRNKEAGFDFIKMELISTPNTNDKFTIFSSKESSYAIKFIRLAEGENWSIYFNEYGVQKVVPFQTGSSLLTTFINIKNEFLNLGFSNIKIDWDLDKSTLYVTELQSTLGDLELYIKSTDQSYTSLANAVAIQTSFNLDNSTYIASDQISAGNFSSTTYSSNGTLGQITKALVSCITNSAQTDFNVLHETGSNIFYIKSKVKGYKLLQSGVLVPKENSIDFLNIENLDTNSLLNLHDESLNSIAVTNNIYYMSGGNSANKSVYVSLDSVADVNIGDYIETKKLNVYNKIIDIVDDVDRIPTTFKRLILERENDLDSGEIKIYADNLARIGLFSAFDIHDMNFDFYDTSNSDLKELKYENSATINYIPEQSTSGTEDEVAVFSNDYDLTPSNYFTGISDVLPEELADQYNEIKLYTEYDRLNENNLKEFALNSRVVPNINKWVLKDTLTVREQPYYLNANEAFGRTNFAPDFSNPGRDRLGMTHEWFYLDKIPKYLQYNQLNDTFSYLNFNEDFDLQPIHFKSTSFDYFDRFMISDGFEIKDNYGIVSFIKTNLKKKYTVVDGGNDTSFASTIFKGLRVNFKSRKEFENITSSDFIKNSEFNGYKFSTIVKVKTGQASNDISYEIIQNKAFNFVVFFITVSLDDLWSNNSINRKLLYEMNHSLVWTGNPGFEVFQYSDVKISGAMNLNSLNTTDPTAIDYLVLTGLTHEDGSIPQFIEQINTDDDNQYGVLKVTINADSGPNNIYLPIASVNDQDELVLSGVPMDSETGGNPVPLYNLPDYLQLEAEYNYLKGGKNAFKNILDSLSISNVYQLLKQNDGQIVYTTIEEDGTSLNNRFQIEFEDGNEVIKESFLLTTTDTDKPKSFKLSKGNIGFELIAGDIYYPFLVRHNGDYTVDTKPVITFTDTYSHFKTNDLQSTINSSELAFEEQMYKHSLTDVEEINLARDYYRRYNRCGTAFNLGFIQDDGTHDNNWGIIKNHFYRKVNEINTSGVTKLSTSTEKLPLYPLIGEIAIDKKDVNVFRSSWDKNYYTRALSGGGSELVPGTFETKEEKSYLGSTVMKPKDSYSLINFNVDYVGSQESQDKILLNGNNKGDVVVFENKENIYIDFYIDSLIKKTLSNDGILNSISRYVTAENSAGDKSTIKDDVEFYITKNLVNLFTVNSIKLYTSRIKGIKSEILTTANIDTLDDGGFEVDKNFTFKQHKQKPLNFRLIYNKRLGYSYRIRPMVKIKS
jgi:hypothetical protein